MKQLAELREWKRRLKDTPNSNGKDVVVLIDRVLALEEESKTIGMAMAFYAIRDAVERLGELHRETTVEDQIKEIQGIQNRLCDAITTWIERRTPQQRTTAAQEAEKWHKKFIAGEV